MKRELSRRRRFEMLAFVALSKLDVLSDVDKEAEADFAASRRCFSVWGPAKMRLAVFLRLSVS